MNNKTAGGEVFYTSFPKQRKTYIHNMLEKIIALFSKMFKSK